MAPARSQSASTARSKGGTKTGKSAAARKRTSSRTSGTSQRGTSSGKGTTARQGTSARTSHQAGKSTPMRSSPDRRTRSRTTTQHVTAGPFGPPVQAAADMTADAMHRARRVLDARGGVPAYAGAGALAVVGVLEWPIAVGAAAGYAALRRWGHRLPEPVKSLTGSRPE